MQESNTKSSSEEEEGGIAPIMSSSGSLQSDFTALVPRYLALFPLHKGWHYEQSQYVAGVKNDWRHAKHRAGTDTIIRHLDRGERFWIGSQCREQRGKPVTSFLLLDLDAKDGGREAAWERLCRIREAFGKEFAPLVYTSPGGGYHAVWFLDRPAPLSALLNLRKPMSSGLVAEVLRSAAGEVKAGVCEVYPQPNRCVRWPLGTDQLPVNAATGLPVAGMDLPEMLETAERHRATVPPLTLEHLQSLRPARSLVAPRRPGAGRREREAEGTVCGISLEAIEAGRRGYRDGLTEPGSRNRVTFQIARVMVLAPDALAELGFDPSADRAEQLLAWLQTRHNGHSEEFAARPDDRDYWRAECERALRGVEEWNGTVQKEAGLFLSEAEWDAVFTLGAAFEGRAAKRYRVEIVAACWLRMAKWSVVRGRGHSAADGTFTAEIHWRWRRQQPFCSKGQAERRYREILQAAGLFRFQTPGDREARKAASFSGFLLDLWGVSPERRYSPAEIHAVAQDLGENATLLAYCLEVEARFPGEQLRKRYGRGGAEFIRKHLARLDAAAGAGAGWSIVPLRLSSESSEDEESRGALAA